MGKPSFYWGIASYDRAGRQPMLLSLAEMGYKRDEIIRKIEHAVEHLTLKELEALSYDMFTKGYFDNL